MATFIFRLSIPFFVLFFCPQARLLPARGFGISNVTLASRRKPSGTATKLLGHQSQTLGKPFKMLEKVPKRLLLILGKALQRLAQVPARQSRKQALRPDLCNPCGHTLARRKSLPPEPGHMASSSSKQSQRPLADQS